MIVALYARVSTAEQAQHGLSIDAQISALRVWANANGHEILCEYIDAGISGKNVLKKRPALYQFIQDLESGLKVDALVFTKLDRLYRSVKLYYQAVEILEKHKCAWIATQEDYETVTASGRFKVNIMLSVAENEADRTSERIKAVFAHKVENGQALTRCQPFGYEVKDGKVVPNEHADAARAMFEYFASTGNTYATRDMIQDKYGVRLNYESVYRFLQNPMYVGRYRDNPNYCAALVSQELFDKVQADFVDRRKTKRPPSGRTYLFSGLLVCAECGRKLTVTYAKASTHQPIRYRCPGHFFGRLCSNNRNISEVYLERQILDVISKLVAGIDVSYKVVETYTPTISKTDVQKKLTRLKELYIDGDVSKDDYTAQRDILLKLIEKPTGKPQDAKMFFGDNFVKEYESLSREQQKALWHRAVDHVTVSRNSEDLYFCPTL